MTRLIAFGCSNTYGQGLESRVTYPFDSLKEPASEFAWPKVLGNLLGINDVINRAEPGASNKHIWERAITFNYRQTDIVFIHWTFQDRDCFFGKIPKIGPWQLFFNDRDTSQEKKNAEYYYKHFYSEEDRFIDLYARVDHVDRYLREKNIRHFHLLTPGNSRGGHASESSKKMVPQWCSARFLKTSFEKTPRLDEGLDDNHAGIETHSSVAQRIYKEIKNT